MAEYEELRELYKKGNLCLFVGAGVSRSCGLPDWSSLSECVVQSAWPDRVQYYDYEHLNLRATLSKGSPLDAMRMARRVLNERLNSTVMRCLYANGVTISATAQAIASLDNVSRVCCFNYDDVLEQAYEERGRKFYPLIEGDPLDLLNEILLIFHPHGFLPQKPREPRGDLYLSERIVLSEDDYHNLYSIPYSWSNLIQMSLLMNYSVLFVGLSLTDPNTRRLLDVCKRMQIKHKHYALLRNPSYHPEAKGWEPLAYVGLYKLQSEIMEDRGLMPVWFNEFSDIPDILHHIGATP